MWSSSLSISRGASLTARVVSPHHFAPTAPRRKRAHAGLTSVRGRGDHVGDPFAGDPEHAPSATGCRDDHGCAAPHRAQRRELRRREHRRRRADRAARRSRAPRTAACAPATSRARARCDRAARAMPSIAIVSALSSARGRPALAIRDAAGGQHVAQHERCAARRARCAWSARSVASRYGTTGSGTTSAVPSPSTRTSARWRELPL